MPAEDLRNRIASRIGKPSGAQYLGPPTADPSNKLRQSIDRAKERISTLPKTPQEVGPATVNALKTNVVNPLVQQAQQRLPNIPQVPNTVPPTANPDRGLIISWIKQQPAFTWLQTVLSQYGINLGEVMPSAPQNNFPGGEPNPGAPMGMTDSSGAGFNDSQPQAPAAPYGEMTNPFSGPTNASGFSNPGFPR